MPTFTPCFLLKRWALIELVLSQRPRGSLYLIAATAAAGGAPLV